MPAEMETSLGPEIPANTVVAIRARMAKRQVSWTGPLTLLSARTILLLLSQGFVMLILFAAHRPASARAAGDWWNVYGTAVDLGCLFSLHYFTRKEGITLRVLVGAVRLQRGRDLFLGVGIFAASFPFFLGGSYFARLLLYGFSGKNPNAYLVHEHSLPVWAIVYSLILWWVIWSPTEEMTYQGYVLPRLQALTGRTWIALAVVGFWWALQHCALPFIPDPRFLLYRFLSFLPGVLVLMMFYLRTRRLTPLIIAHWPMDIAATVVTAIYSGN